MGLAGVRRDVSFVVASFGYSERGACKLLEIDRASYRYRAMPNQDEQLRRELINLAGEHPHKGYRQLHVLLRERGWNVNHKRVYRLCREAFLVRRQRTGGRTHSR